MSETYTHLLIPTSKICRPTAKSVSLFMEQIILTGSIGQDNHISFAKVAKVEPRFQEARNPFTGEILKMTVPSSARRRLNASRLLPRSSSLRSRNRNTTCRSQASCCPRTDVWTLALATVVLGGHGKQNRFTWTFAAVSVARWFGCVSSSLATIRTHPLVILRR